MVKKNIIIYAWYCTSSIYSQCFLSLRLVCSSCTVSLVASKNTFVVLTGLTPGFLWAVMLSYGWMSLSGLTLCLQPQKDVRSFPLCVCSLSEYGSAHSHYCSGLPGSREGDPSTRGTFTISFSVVIAIWAL